MNNIIISTEASSDLTKDLIKKYDIHVAPFEYFVNGESFDTEKNDIPSQMFYEDMKNGADVKTSQINLYQAKEYLENLLKTGKEVLHICFSSGLSGTYENFVNAAEELNKTYTNKCRIVDSLCAAGGEGLLTILACKKNQQNEISLEDLADYIKNITMKLNHIFTVDDLKYLVKGGRVSKTSAFIANFLRIKPMLNVNEQGKLAVTGKVFGRKMAVKKIFDTMKRNFDTEFSDVFISQANCMEDAEALQRMIKDEYNIDAKILPLSCLIGCHSGPGTLALFYIGDKR